MAKFTIFKEQGHFNLQQTGRTVAVLSECDEEAAKWVALEMNDASTLRQKYAMAATEIIKLEQQRDELLDSLNGILVITDRKHDAWDKARTAIAKAEGREELIKDKARLEWVFTLLPSLSRDVIDEELKGES